MIEKYIKYTKSNLLSSFDSKKQLILIIFYFFLWYFFTIIYNISNKLVLNVLPLPFFVSLLQLSLVLLLFILIDKYIEKFPKISLHTLYFEYGLIGLFHGLGLISTNISIQHGSVSFTHIVKALEPVFAAILSILFLNKNTLPLVVYVSLVPIIVGVALASNNEVTFTWIGIISAMSSNLFYQLRIVFAKKELNKNIQNSNNSNNLPENKNNLNNNISSSNLYRILTIVSSIELIPLCLIFEGSKIISIWQKALELTTSSNLMLNIIISSFSFYMYNEVAFWILDIVSPITHAVGNTIKRIVIILASVIILKSEISIQSIIGSFIAIFGTFCYAIAQNSSKKS